MDPEYIIMSSDYGLAAQQAKDLDIDIHQWRWIRDKFKEPIIYKLYKEDIPISILCKCDKSPLFPRCNKNPEYCTKLNPPDWCDDCNANPGEKCPDCGYTHNC